MGKVEVCITLREDLWIGFRSRGLTNLSGAVEEFLEAFLSSLPIEYRRRSAKETRELVRRFIEGRPVQETTPQELLQQLISLLQTLPQPLHPQQETHQETYPPTQPEPIAQAPQQSPSPKTKQKNPQKTQTKLTLYTDKK